MDEVLKGVKEIKIGQDKAVVAIQNAVAAVQQIAKAAEIAASASNQCSPPPSKAPRACRNFPAPWKRSPPWPTNSRTGNSPSVPIPNRKLNRRLFLCQKN